MSSSVVQDAQHASSPAATAPTHGPIVIDLRRVIASKNPALLSVLPGFAIRYVERIVHVRELNRAFREMEGRSGLGFLAESLDALGVTVVSRGEEHLQAARKALVVANHPLGGVDGMALVQAVGMRLGKIHVPANDLLMNVPQLQDFFVPVNKHGSNADNFDRFEQAFASETAMVHFPAGLCSRKRAGRIRDLRWQKSFVVRARRHRRDIVPVHIDGENSRFFYNLARLRRWFGIRFNFEMIYLVDEMFKQRSRTLTLTIGAPIRWESLDRSITDWEWARRLRRHVYRLASDPEARFSP
jgi:putative hemolysin